jgi:hypothetical protein
MLSNAAYEEDRSSTSLSMVVLSTAVTLSGPSLACRTGGALRPASTASLQSPGTMSLLVCAESVNPVMRYVRYKRNKYRLPAI